MFIGHLVSKSVFFRGPDADRGSGIDSFHSRRESLLIHKVDTSWHQSQTPSYTNIDLWARVSGSERAFCSDNSILPLDICPIRTLEVAGPNVMPCHCCRNSCCTQCLANLTFYQTAPTRVYDEFYSTFPMDSKPTLKRRLSLPKLFQDKKLKTADDESLPVIERRPSLGNVLHSMDQFIRARCISKEVADHLLTIRSCVSMFKDFWYKRDAKKINAMLTHLSSELGSFIDAFCPPRGKIVEEHKTAAMYYLLDKLDGDRLEGILKIPSKITDEDKQIFITSRKRAIEAWQWFKDQFDCQHYKENNQKIWKAYVKLKNKK